MIAAIFGVGVLMIGAVGCGGSDTAAPATTTQVETVATPAATPATTVTVDQNNDNTDDNDNDNDNSDETLAQQKAECLANNKDYPENCADIP